MNRKGRIAGEPMREQQSEKSNLESRIFRTKLANSPGSKHRESFIAVLLMAVFLLTSATAQDTNKSKPEPLMIQEQGSFAVGPSIDDFRAHRAIQPDLCLRQVAEEPAAFEGLWRPQPPGRHRAIPAPRR
jgi:hypothetical protein